MRKNRTVLPQKLGFVGSWRRAVKWDLKEDKQRIPGLLECFSCNRGKAEPTNAVIVGEDGSWGMKLRHDMTKTKVDIELMCPIKPAAEDWIREATEIIYWIRYTKGGCSKQQAKKRR